jgi:hypothetical protein
LHCPGTPVLLRFPVRATLTAPAVAPITFDAHLVASSSDSATLSAIATFPAGPTPIGLWLGKGNAELIAGRPAVRWSTLCGEDPNAVAARVLGASLADVLAEAARGPLVCEKAGGTATNAISPATPQLSLGALTGPACRQQANLAAISIPVQLTVNAADGWIAHSLNGHVALDERTKTAKISGTGRLPVTERTREWLGCPSVSGHYTVNVFATLGTQTPNASLELELISSCEDTSIRCTGTVR